MWTTIWLTTHTSWLSAHTTSRFTPQAKAIVSYDLTDSTQ